ncbi:MAG: hypothetical protein ACRD0C_14890, partial [Acidimicrobiia bacterium]
MAVTRGEISYLAGASEPEDAAAEAFEAQRELVENTPGFDLRATVEHVARLTGSPAVLQDRFL